jgi:hypothetical protein
MGKIKRAVGQGILAMRRINDSAIKIENYVSHFVVPFVSVLL